MRSINLSIVRSSTYLSSSVRLLLRILLRHSAAAATSPTCAIVAFTQLVETSAPGAGCDAPACCARELGRELGCHATSHVCVAK